MEFFFFFNAGYISKLLGQLVCEMVSRLPLNHH